MESSENKNKSITIAIDAMGGDHGLQTTVSGAAKALSRNPNLHFLMFGDELELKRMIALNVNLSNASEIIHTDKVVGARDKPSAALRGGEGTSMRMALEAVSSGKAQVAVSGGNTGALMALAKSTLRTLPGIHRPAIASVFPSASGETIMLDLGANVLVEAEHLVQFALLGALFAKVHMGIQRPSIGLLNVGSEPSKGPDHVRMAAQILSQVEMPANYHGFVEANDIMASTVNVVVSDGYAGNIALKASEGMAKFTGRLFKESLAGDPLSKLGAALSFFGLRRFKSKLDPRMHNGGVFLGLGGLCVKSHGGSDAFGFSTAIGLAAEVAGAGYIDQLAQELANLASQNDSLLRV